MHTKEKLVYNIEETAELLGVHRNTVAKYVARGIIPARKLGPRWLIPTKALQVWLEGRDKTNPAAQDGGTKEDES